MHPAHFPAMQKSYVVKPYACSILSCNAPGLCSKRAQMRRRNKGYSEDILGDQQCSETRTHLGVPWEAGWSGLESGAGGESGDRMGDPPGTLPLEDDEALSVTTSFHELATDPLVLLAWHASPVCRVGSFFSNRFSNMGWTSPSAGSSASSPPVRLRSAASASKMRRASSSSGQPCSVLPPELAALLPLPAADGLLLLLLVVLIATPFPACVNESIFRRLEVGQLQSASGASCIVVTIIIIPRYH